MSYQVGVDLGTTYSAAAVCRSGRDTAELVPLGERSHAVASAVFDGGHGAFLVGEAAERRALAEPGRVVREFKRRIGDGTPVLVGREPVAAEALAARFIARMLHDVAAREGEPPSRVAVTHPAGWGPHKVESLSAALTDHGVGPVSLLSEPQAAAVGYASAERVEPGAVVAVYDLGGGTFDAAVVRKLDAGGFELLGTPEGIERLGGVDFDEAVFEHVRAGLGEQWETLDASDPEVLAAVARLRRECTAAKEALSADTEVLVPVMLPGIHTRVRLGRAEFEEMIRPAVLETVEAMRTAIGSAGLTPGDLTALLLVGGSSRIPLVTQLVSDGLGRPASVDADPKGVIAAGAALVAAGVERAVATPAVDGEVAGDPGSDEPPAPDAGAAPPDLPAVRPPKQASPFPVTAGPDRSRLVVLVVVATLFTAAVLGGALAFGATRIGAGNEAVASTRPVPSSSPVRAPVVGTPQPRQAPPAARPQATVPPTSAARVAPAAPPTTPAAPPTTTTAPPPPPPSSEAPATTTTPPAPAPAAAEPEAGADAAEGAPAGG